MLVTFDDLVAYSEQLANQLPELSRGIQIRRPGCREDVITDIALLFPSIPSEYLTVIRELDLVGISIGYFHLTPCCATADGFLEALREANDPKTCPNAKEAQRRHLYLIGQWESEPIGIARTNSRHMPAGTIVMLSHDDASAPSMALAESFRGFLLIAGNLDMIRALENEARGPVGSLATFDAYLHQRTPELSNDAIRNWGAIAEVVLS